MKFTLTFELVVLLACTQAIASAAREPLIPVGIGDEGWAYAPDIGWIYAIPEPGSDGWFWATRSANWVGTGDWIYATPETYPFYWHHSDWTSINQNTIGYNYTVRVDREDALVGKTFQSIEAYIPTPFGQGYMRPSVKFMANNKLESVRSDVISTGLWTVVQGVVLTSSSWVGDDVWYNAHSEIIFVDQQKFELIDDAQNPVP